MPIDIDKWFGRIIQAESVQSERWSEWKDNVDFLTGDWFTNKFGEDAERVEVTFLHSYVRTLIPAIYFKDPRILIRSRNSENQSFSETMEEVINYIWEELRLKAEIRSSIFDAILQPPGWIKIGFTAKFGEDVSELKDGALDISRIIEDAVEKSKKSPEESGILDEIKEESLFAQHIPSWRILLAPGYHKIRSMPYLVEIEDIHIDDLKRNKSYKKVKSEVKPSRSVSSIAKSGVLKVEGPMGHLRSMFGAGSQGNEFARLYHIWDRREQVRFTLAENFRKDTLFDGDWPYGMDSFPYIPLIFNEIPQTKDRSNAYPLSDVKPLAPQLIELSMARTQMVKHRKRSGTIVVIRKGEWTQDQVSNFENAEDVSVIEVENLNPQTLLNWTPPPLPGDVYKINDIITQDIMRESGMAQLLQVNPTPGVETLGEARIIQAGSELRTSDKVSIIEDFTVDIARGLASLAWEFLDRQRVSEIMGRLVSLEEWPVLPEDKDERRRILQAELAFRIDSGSTRPPQDNLVEQRLWRDHMIAIKQMFPHMVNDEVLLQQFLKKIEFKDFERAIRGNSELEVQAAQQENEMLDQNIPIPGVSPNERHDIHIPIHSQGQMTQAKQLHIMEHQKMMQLGSAQQPGQGGSAQTQRQVTAPELMRQGTPTGSDLAGSTMNLGRTLGESGPT